MVSKGYRDLVVWQNAMDLVDQIYQITRSFPKDENFGLTSQIRRSAISIPSNIAEGHGRSSPKEFRRFLRMALGSLAELDTQLEIALRQAYITPDQSESLSTAITQLRKMLHGLIRSLNTDN